MIKTQTSSENLDATPFLVWVKLLCCSFFGIGFFLVPFTYDGSWTIVLGVAWRSFRLAWRQHEVLHLQYFHCWGVNLCYIQSHTPFICHSSTAKSPTNGISLVLDTAHPYRWYYCCYDPISSGPQLDSRQRYWDYRIY